MALNPETRESNRPARWIAISLGLLILLYMHWEEFRWITFIHGDFWIRPFLLTVLVTGAICAICYRLQDLADCVHTITARSFQPISKESFKQSLSIVRSIQRVWLIAGIIFILLHIQRESVLIGPPQFTTEAQCWLHIAGVALFCTTTLLIGYLALEIVRIHIGKALSK
jgi:hypothetical protein